MLLTQAHVRENRGEHVHEDEEEAVEEAVAAHRLARDDAREPERKGGQLHRARRAGRRRRVERKGVHDGHAREERGLCDCRRHVQEERDDHAHREPEERVEDEQVAREHLVRHRHLGVVVLARLHLVLERVVEHREADHKDAVHEHRAVDRAHVHAVRVRGRVALVEEGSNLRRHTHVRGRRARSQCSCACCVGTRPRSPR